MVNVWLDYPPRNSLKIFTTIVEALEKIDISQPRRHITAIKNWNYLTIAVKATPITANEENSLKNFVTACFSTWLCLQIFFQRNAIAITNYLMTSFTILLTRYFLLTSKRESLYDDYAFNIIPATDDKPFFLASYD